MSYGHRHHGSVRVGRVMVVAGCLLVLGANALVFKAASAPPRPIPTLEILTIISLVWMFAGAAGTCARLDWARFLMLTVLYMGSLGFFMAGIITVATDGGLLVGRLTPIFIATGVYLLASLVLTHSKHVRRLTSRALE